MFTQQEYYWAWAFYLVGAGLCMLFAWVVSARFRWLWLKFLTRAAVAAFLVTPWTTTEGEKYLTPAWVVSVFETLLDGPEAFWRAGMPLIVAVVAAMILAVLASILLSFASNRR